MKAKEFKILMAKAHEGKTITMTTLALKTYNEFYQGREDSDSAKYARQFGLKFFVVEGNRLLKSTKAKRDAQMFIKLNQGKK